jgi:[NiFe] hydrogenase diaphorase moiety small subunit
MSNMVTFKIDGKACEAEQGSYLVDAAAKNDIYIPTLCNYPGVKPRGSCRICNVKINGRMTTACTTRVQKGMEIENETPELEKIRKSIVELMFVEGNHLCPTCERSGSCELQAMGYRYNMMVPEFPYQYPVCDVDGSTPKLIKDHNRCILCKRCIRGIKTEDGKSFFTFSQRGNHTAIIIDKDLAAQMTDEQADKVMEICPVGALLKKEKGFDIPIGERKYDKTPIGSDIENK